MFTSLFELFGNRFFRIPNYQRGYAWVEEQRKDLWEDIASLRDGMEHYAGTIVLRKLDASAFPEDSFERAALTDPSIEAYDVVDGQQRLTTLVILVNELLRFLGPDTDVPMDVVPEGSVSTTVLKERFLFRGNRLGGYYALDYVGDSEESDHLKTVVFKGETGWEEDRLTSYMRNLQNASKFFRDNIAALARRGGREAVLDFLVRSVGRFRFNQINLSDDYNVGVAFETMNNRGLQLSNLELLKNRLLYLTELFGGDRLSAPARSRLRNSIVKAWHTIYLQLGRDSRIVLNDDEFLKAHWSVYFMFTKRRGNDCFEFLLRKQFVPDLLSGGSSADVISGPADPQEEVTDNDDDDDDNDAAPGVGGLLELTPEMINDYVTDLADFSGWWQKVHCPDRPGAGLLPQVVEELTRLRHLGMGYFKPLLAAAIKVGATRPDDVATLFGKIERFYFKAFRLGTSRSNYGQTEFLGVARRLYKGEISLQSLLDDDLWNRLENRDFVSQFKGKVSDLRRKGEGFYKWNGIRYFLFEYNSELARERQREPSLVWDDYNRSSEGTVSIEHILPQSPAIWYWRNQFRPYLNNPGEMRLLTGALGNLLPLSLHINIHLQNDPFERKKEGRPSRNGQGGFGGYRYGCSAEVEVAESPDWSANEIYERSHLLMDFLRRRWNVEISAEDEREILGLEFVNDGREIPPELPNEPETQPTIVARNGRGLSSEEMTAWKSAFARYVGYEFNDTDLRGGHHDLRLGKKLIRGAGRRSYCVEFQFCAYASRQLMFLIYSRIPVVPADNPDRNLIVGPYFKHRIEQVRSVLADAFHDDYPPITGNTEGVCARVILNRQPDVLSEDDLNNLRRGYETLVNIWNELPASG